MDMPDKNSNDVSRKLWRWIYVSAGITCVILAGIGVFLPIMPTVIFLIAACYFFARSAPHLEKILVRNRFFASFLPMVDGRRRLSPLAKAFVLAFMWCCAAVSCSVLFYYGVIPLWLIGLVIALNGAVSYFIIRN